jgi:predicted  nucleic acid-binding Zn-ribbon protein
MNIAEKLKSNIVVIPVVASIVVGSFTGIKYIVSLTATINDNKEQIVQLHNKIDQTNDKLKKAQEDISNIFGVIQMSKEIMEIMGSQISDLQWEVRDLTR